MTTDRGTHPVPVPDWLADFEPVAEEWTEDDRAAWYAGEDEERATLRAREIEARVGFTGKKREPRVRVVAPGARWIPVGKARTQRAARRRARNLRDAHWPLRRYCIAPEGLAWAIVLDTKYRAPGTYQGCQDER